MDNSLTIVRNIVAIIRDLLIIAVIITALILGVRVIHNLNEARFVPAQVEQPCLIDPQSRACLDR